MTVETICPGCSRKLQVASEHVGRQARCPICNVIYTVAGGPPEQEASAGDEGGSWRMRTPEGQIYGPADKQQLDQWVREGRVTEDCQLSNDESPWTPASNHYPVLAEMPAPPLPRSDPQQAGNDSESHRQFTPASSRPASGPRYRFTTPHRGALILALAIIGWVVTCPVFGILAWVMGSSDLREMRMGRMDPSGMGLTQAGQIIGMINAVLFIIVAVILLFVMLIGLAVS